MHAITLRFGSLAPIIEAVETELLSARKKFPGNKMMLTALTEEHGEIVQAMLNQFHKKNSPMTYELDEYDSDNEKIKKELIQTIVMCIRVLTEGDSDFPYNPN